MAVREPAHRKLTYDDYVLFPEDGLRHEILDGEHYVSPAPSRRHQDVSVNLLRFLLPFVHDRRLGRVYHAPTDVLLSEHDIVQPDLLFVSNTRAHVLTDANVQGAPDLVVEILSKSTRKRDEGLKRERYDRLGVGEIWLVDRERHEVRIHLRQGGGLRLVATLAAERDDRLTTPLLSGLAIPLREIFE